MKAVLNRVHLPRPDWYEELYAVAMAASMKSYEDEKLNQVGSGQNGPGLNGPF
ncbi:hypothetical protein HanHA300_Chr10g0375731 [Helianthus annuus]|nr:hypothetical protein HanHA300_Chr10g0375731 [Helianthus annuus]KAJ0573253.1 hypothetical protein HanHA89_Chr06g0224721 [Helianthus annuus]KAJ0701377.1 hypothetical protein HanOQP8_Chr10g0378701 [Helianthus annuus]